MLSGCWCDCVSLDTGVTLGGSFGVVQVLGVAVCGLGYLPDTVSLWMLVFSLDVGFGVCSNCFGGWRLL